MIDAAPSARNDQRKPSTEKKQEGKRGQNETPPLEWAVAGVGLVLVVGALALMLYNAIWKEPSPPEITVRIISIVQVQNGFLAQFETTNEGGTTAEGVVVGAELKRGSEHVESSHTTVDYLPPNSKKRGGLFFTRDPRQFDFQARAFGYQEP